LTLKPVTLITGASAGIGAAFARLFAERGHECAFAARCGARLTALADEIAAAGAGLYESQSPFLSHSAEQIARDAYDAFMAGQRVVVPGIGNKIAAALPRVMPRALVLRAVEAFERKAGPAFR